MNGSSVYKTRTGRKHHCNNNCISIIKETTLITLVEAGTRGLDSCRICIPGTRNRTVSVTRTGRRYHMGNCISIIKQATPLRLSEAEILGLGPCKLCCI